MHVSRKTTRIAFTAALLSMIAAQSTAAGPDARSASAALSLQRAAGPMAQPAATGLNAWSGAVARDPDVATTATYRLTFESTWSETTHPQGFPGGPHFSGLIGGTHNASVSFWSEAVIASDGIESMAETGSKTLLQGEVSDAIAAGTAEFVVSGGGIGLSPGVVSVTFDITLDYPLVTVVSMLAPSPDWFVGVSGLSLMDGSGWAPEVVIPLMVYDAGTDSGTDYGSPNEDTDPPDQITPLTEPPFDSDNVVGSFTFTLQSAVATEPVPGERPSLDISAAFPNPARNRVGISIVSGRSQRVQASLYDLFGRRVRVLDLGVMDTGNQRFVQFDTSDLAAEVYFLRVSAGRSAVVRSVVLQR